MDKFINSQPNQINGIPPKMMLHQPMISSQHSNFENAHMRPYMMSQGQMPMNNGVGPNMPNMPGVMCNQRMLPFPPNGMTPNSDHVKMMQLSAIANSYPIEKLTLKVCNGNLYGPFHLAGDENGVAPFGVTNGGGPISSAQEFEFELTEHSLSQIQGREDLDIVLLSRYTRGDNCINFLVWPPAQLLRVSLNTDDTVLSDLCGVGNGQPNGASGPMELIFGGPGAATVPGQPPNGSATQPSRIPLHQPYFIKQWCVVGRNVLKFHILEPQKFNCKMFEFHVYMVHRPTIAHAKKSALEQSGGSGGSAEDELSLLRLLQDQCMKLHRDHVLISPICPITNRRIEIPVRFRDCCHLQPIDLVGFFRLYARWMLNLCPFCYNGVHFNFNGLQQNLVIDPVLQNIFNKAPPNCEAIRMLHDGNFIFHTSNGYAPPPQLAPHHPHLQQQQQLMMMEPPRQFAGSTIPPGLQYRPPSLPPTPQQQQQLVNSPLALPPPPSVALSSASQMLPQQQQQQQHLMSQTQYLNPSSNSGSSSNEQRSLFVFQPIDDPSNLGNTVPPFSQHQQQQQFNNFPSTQLPPGDPNNNNGNGNKKQASSLSAPGSGQQQTHKRKTPSKKATAAALAKSRGGLDPSTNGASAQLQHNGLNNATQLPSAVVINSNHHHHSNNLSGSTNDCSTPPSTRTSSVASTSSPDSLNVPQTSLKRPSSSETLANTVLSECSTYPLSDEQLLPPPVSSFPTTTSSLLQPPPITTSLYQQQLSSTSSQSFMSNIYSQQPSLYSANNHHHQHHHSTSSSSSLPPSSTTVTTSTSSASTSSKPHPSKLLNFINHILDEFQPIMEPENAAWLDNIDLLEFNSEDDDLDRLLGGVSVTTPEYRPPSQSRSAALTPPP